MRPTGPKLDRHGFPIPPDFEGAGVEDPGRSGGWGPWPRRLAKLAVIGVIVAALWHHYDFGARIAEMAGMYHARAAVDAALREAWDDALDHADRAVAWKPQSVTFLLLRARVKHERQEFDAALADVEAALAIKPNDAAAQHLRMGCLLRLQRHREAAAAAGDALGRSLGDRAELLNARAYARALGDFELDEALVDIEEALAEPSNEDNASYLDTRGYVLLKLGRYDDALADFERAIAVESERRDKYERDMHRRPLSPSDRQTHERRRKLFDENLAVMHYHRGEVHEKLGHAEQAKKDRFIGEELGFDPAAGVY